MTARYLIVLSREHAEELLPHAGPRVLERIEKHVASTGAVILELNTHGLHRLLVAENGVQVANRAAAGRVSGDQIARELLRPADATNDGSRRVRELLRRRTFGAIAKQLRCDERAVRMWAREDTKPSLVLRARIEDVFAIPASAWDEEPTPDVYAAGKDPPTARKG